VKATHAGEYDYITGNLVSSPVLCVAAGDNNNHVVVLIFYHACSGGVNKIKTNSLGIRIITLVFIPSLLLPAYGRGLHH
ncbi:MAG: hypothetical protein OEV12_06690, partial [Gammaproteobacteria bacterium]|nr:hypothetical protein [Gammaproteobacteria bacterium]